MTAIGTIETFDLADGGTITVSYAGKGEWVPTYSSKRMDLFDLLDQDKVWQTKTGEVVRLKDMTPSHRENTLRLLLRGAQSYKVSYEFRLLSWAPSGDMACDDWDAIVDELSAKDSVVWLSEFPLVQKLQKLVAKDQRRAAKEQKRAGTRPLYSSFDEPQWWDWRDAA